MTIGKYKGIEWAKIPLCDLIYCTSSKRLVYCLRYPIYDGQDSGQYTGDHFTTQRAMFAWIDENRDSIVNY